MLSSMMFLSTGVWVNVYIEGIHKGSTTACDLEEGAWILSYMFNRDSNRGPQNFMQWMDISLNHPLLAHENVFCDQSLGV
jgi:hypothetical protein